MLILLYIFIMYVYFYIVLINELYENLRFNFTLFNNTLKITFVDMHFIEIRLIDKMFCKRQSNLTYYSQFFIKLKLIHFYIL